MLQTGYKPYFDREFESLIARIHPPRVTIDNDSRNDCTLVKVDSANKHGILLEMVQVLTDLDLVISKSYICSDGDWFMDVFHVTDQLGNKITDDTLIHYIQRSLCAGRTGARANQMEVKRYWGDRLVQPSHLLSEQYTALEMTTIDQPGLLSEVSAVLVELGCQVVSAVAWTHNTRAACIIYVEDESKGGSITDPHRLAHIEDKLGNVLGAHNGIGEKRRVRLAPPTVGRTHTERRLHQLMYADRDYERCGCRMASCGVGESSSSASNSIMKMDLLGSSRGYNGSTQVSIENCQEKGYSVVNITSRDRPKLLFDTVCALTDMQYVVFHAAISSKGSLAAQEYYVRHMDGCTLDGQDERWRVVQSLVAAVERRVSHGLRLDVCTRDRTGLLSDITRVFREHGLSVTRAEIGIRGERAIGSFFVMEASGKDVDEKTVQMLQNEIEGTGASLVVNKSPAWSPLRSLSPASSSSNHSNSSSADQIPNRSSFGSMLWAQLERLSGIKSS